MMGIIFGFKDDIGFSFTCAGSERLAKLELGDA